MFSDLVVKLRDAFLICGALLLQLVNRFRLRLRSLFARLYGRRRFFRWRRRLRYLRCGGAELGAGSVPSRVGPVG
jgi:hypothetical protein